MSEIITIDEPFPVDISFGSTSTIQYNTDVVTVTSGVENRNANWIQNRNTYDASMGIRDKTYLDNLISFFHVAKGKLHPFLYKDWADYTSLGKNATLDAIPGKSDQVIGFGDDGGSGGTEQFQLIKTYEYGKTTIRDITHPVVGSVLISIDNVLIETGYSVNYTTGIITFTTAPLAGETIRAGYEFWVPCRFDTDSLSINLEMYQHGSTNVPIIEVRP